MIKQSTDILNQMRYQNGLFSAAAKNVATGYHRAWIRDNVYTALGFEALGKKTNVQRVYRALLDILHKHETKIDWAIREKPSYHFQYIHPRYDPETLNEIWEEWGNKQNDAIGALLFKIGDLEEKGIKILRNKDDLRIIQKLVHYLASVEYWHDEDHGIWEMEEEVHASSVGACVAGLKKISKLVDVNASLIKKGERTLKLLLPRESKTKGVDLALLSLIYPYNVVSKKMAERIVQNVEDYLVRERGVIRFKEDYYYNNGAEAEWTMGLPWLAIIYKQLGRPDKYAYYMRKTMNASTEKGELPELYYGLTPEHNENTPLAWSQALAIVMHKL